MGMSPTSFPHLQSGLQAHGCVLVTAQGGLSEVEPKAAAVQGLQAAGPPQKARAQKQLPAPQEQPGRGE